MTSHTALLRSGLSIKQQQSGWEGANGRRERLMSLRRQGQTNWEASSFRISPSIIFYSDVDSNYCLFPQAEWICNFVHLLESWQFDNCRSATAVLATKVLPLSSVWVFLSTSLHTQFWHDFFFSLLCLKTRFLFMLSSPFPLIKNSSSLRNSLTS